MKPTDLLDRNGTAHQKKISAADPAYIQQLRSLSPAAPDVASAVYAAIFGCPIPLCPQCASPIGLDARGQPKKRFCSLKCLNASPEVADKIRQKKLSATPEQKTASNNKRAETCLTIYGVSHVMKDPARASAAAAKGNPKRIQTAKIKAEQYLRDHGYLSQQAHLSKEAREMLADSALLTKLFLEDKLTLNEIADRIGCSPSTVTNRLKELGLERKDHTLSQGENELFRFVQGLLAPGTEIIRNDRKVFSNTMELDLFVPLFNLAIEYHGIYWHSLDGIANAAMENRLRHQKKALACEEKGIRLIQIFEDEWRDKRSHCEALISNVLNLGERVGARECKVELLTDPSVSRAFFEKNHMSGHAPAAGIKTYGLIHKKTGKLLCAMSIASSRFAPETKTQEMIRFATERGYNVVGGGSKLIKAWQERNPGVTLTTYSDLRFGWGGGYVKMGFSSEGYTQPGYSWVVGKERISRYSVNKKIISQHPACDPSLSEDDNMFLRVGARKLYDAGHRRFSFV